MLENEWLVRRNETDFVEYQFWLNEWLVVHLSGWHELSFKLKQGIWFPSAGCG